MGIKGKGRLLAALAVALVFTVLLIPKQNASALSVENAIANAECIAWYADMADHPLLITPQAAENGRVPLSIRFNEYAAGDQIVSVSYDSTGHVAGIGMITSDATQAGVSDGLRITVPLGSTTRVYLLDGSFAPKAPGIEIYS